MSSSGATDGWSAIPCAPTGPSAEPDPKHPVLHPGPDRRGIHQGSRQHDRAPEAVDLQVQLVTVAIEVDGIAGRERQGDLEHVAVAVGGDLVRPAPVEEAR